MGAGTKILAGCGCLALVTGIALTVGVGLGLFWLKGRATEMTAGLQDVAARVDEIDEWEEKANAHPYAPPQDGLIPESRLVTFLGVRREVHEVYLEHKEDLERLRKRTQQDGTPLSPSELLTLGGQAVRMFADLRLAQVRALAEKGMSEREYYAIQTAVYVAAGAAEAETHTGRMPAEAMSEASRQIQDAVRVALETAQRQGLPGADRVSEARVKQLERRLARMGEGGAEALTVPPANVELFRKHRADIRKYAMHGLAFLGL